MRKWLITLTLLIAWIIPTPVFAATSAEVTITASGYIVGAPGGLTLTYISDYEVGISWTKGSDAVNTMVRGAVGRVPKNRTDGYLVYNGAGTSTSDTGVSLDETAAYIYYVAWSQNAGGLWEDTGVSGFIGGAGMLLIAIVLLVLGLTIAAFFIKSGMLYAACIPAWFIFTFVAFNVNWPTENPYIPTAIAVFGVAMTILMVAVTGMHYVGNQSSEPTYDEEKAANLRKIYSLTHKRQPWE